MELVFNKQNPKENIKLAFKCSWKHFLITIPYEILHDYYHIVASNINNFLDKTTTNFIPQCKSY